MFETTRNNNEISYENDKIKAELRPSKFLVTIKNKKTCKQFEKSFEELKYAEEYFREEICASKAVVNECFVW